MEKIETKKVMVPPGKGRRPEMEDWTIEECVLWELKDGVTQILKMPSEKLDVKENLAEFGFDSISLGEFASVLSDRYEIDITPDLFFSYPTLERLSHYLLERYANEMQKLYQEGEEVSLAKAEVAATVGEELKRKERKIRRNDWSRTSPITKTEPLAIIGMSGRFPEARSVEELWDLLYKGKEVIKEAPLERVEWSKEERKGKKFGAVPGMAEFDPLFFEISPREASYIDPRQRLLLQETWKALEDAGYGPKSFKGEKVGMFVGIEDGEYRTLVDSEARITSNHNAILAARLSYFLDLDGPNMAINTACSSSLVAVHQACQSLWNGECDTAIVAGANLMITPESYNSMQKAGMLSEDGKCYAFDKRANGMVPGEAVGVVVLKRQSKAEADRNPIYATIMGSGINYDGKTNGITAPSGNSQSKLIREVYERYKVNPQDMEYIVTHGTGTKLGDPVEINALAEAFKNFTEESRYCALTSVKPNIGHTLAASGIVSLISLVMSLKKEMIPASINCDQLNDYIQWEDSPFYVNSANREWKDREGKKRLSAVSSFGMSGTNAHVVVQSYVPERIETRHLTNSNEKPYYLLALSAKTPESLQRKIDDLREMFEQNQHISPSELANISYTLMDGRHHFRYRLAVVVRDAMEAIRVLEQADSTGNVPNMFKGTLDRHFTPQAAMVKNVEELIERSQEAEGNPKTYKENLYALAELYCMGYEVSGEEILNSLEPYKLRLPTYPFMQEEYWSTNVDTGQVSTGKAEAIHPLLHRNTSNFYEQKYCSVFSGEEFFMKDHVINGNMTFPGVAYLEMVRAAIHDAMGNEDKNLVGLRLKNIAWIQPITIVDNPTEVSIGLNPEKYNEIGYKVYTEDGEEGITVHNQGSAVWIEKTGDLVLDLQTIKESCNELVGSQQCYDTLSRMHMVYGPSFQAVKEIRVGTDLIIAQISIPEIVRDTMEQFLLHPSMLDGALQASIGFALHAIETKPSVPFAIDEMEVYGHCESNMWSVIKKVNSADSRVVKYDIDLCDDKGHVCVRIKGYTSRVLEGSIKEDSVTETRIMQVDWKEKQIIEREAPRYQQHIVIYCDFENVPSDLHFKGKGLHSVQSIALTSRESNIDLRYQTYAVKIFEVMKEVLSNPSSDRLLLQVIIPKNNHSEIYRGFVGMLKTAYQENPKITTKLIEIDSMESNMKTLSIIKAEMNNPEDIHIRYQDGKRLVPEWKQAELQEVTTVPWREQGVYLITGGAGKLGMIFAREIAEQLNKGTIILTGRSPEDIGMKKKMNEIQEMGVTCNYHQVDITNKIQVKDLIQRITEEYGTLNGIIHGAGIMKDNYIMKKSTEEFTEVLAPKVTGTVNLDEASMDLHMDFFILFSSISGSMGNPGQSDYAAANDFMNHYANYRNALVMNGFRNGKTLSINWPLWQEGGMSIAAKSQEIMEKNSGLIAMPTEKGIQAFYGSWQIATSQVMCLYGNVNKYLNLVQKPNNHIVQSTKIQENQVGISDTDQGMMKEKTALYLKKLLSGTLNLSVNQLETDAPMEEYGIDSMMTIELTNELEKNSDHFPKRYFLNIRL
ncbi:type I polyketide synthase [Ornithinibacillus scapharcae]|uniref:type I polyketide synthase n=1 Tax=Ornithinibacillus scapharcae TaxID=1147159 RepID=UPI001300C43F|nr:SDR family NAD(P)-dependent oxidoreductase [Ornithinibacillus scapharcae]